MSILLVVILIGIVLVMWVQTREQFYQPTPAKNTEPPFKYPVDIQQPFGPQGWGYRDPNATLQTLLWDQSQEPVLMPNPYLQPELGYYSHLVESAPVMRGCAACGGAGLLPEAKVLVEKKHSPFQESSDRPVVPYIHPRQVATSPYANWAS